MKTFKLTLIAVSCAALLTACSSSSGGADNSEQIRQTETALTKKLVELNQQVQSAQQKAESAQSNYTSAKTQSDKAQEDVITLNAKVAELTKTLAELNTKLAETQSAQIELAKQNLENQNTLKNVETSKVETDKQNTEYQNKIKELDEQAKKVAEELNSSKQKLEEAQKEANTASKAVEELNKKAAEEQAKREETEKRLKELENLQADEKARIPLSTEAFGGIDGIMKKTISGATLNVDSDGNNIIEAALPRENISQLAVISSEGKVIQVPLNILEGLTPSRFDKFRKYIRNSDANISNTSEFEHTAFGIYNDEIFSAKKYVYAHGTPTAIDSMPKGGIVNYEGGVAYTKEGKRWDERALMTATADFANKNILLTINEEKAGSSVKVPQMEFGGPITGNSFAAESKDKNIKSQGGFFGEGAKELSGVFTNESDKGRGAFGAIKQEAAAQ